MKRILAALLTLVMLLPMCLVVQAEGVATQPFYTVNWGNVVEGEYSNVFQMPYFWANASKVKKGEAYVSWGVSDIKELAQKTKELFNARPEGTRYINFNLPHAAHHELNEDACILEKAIPLVSGWLEKFLAEYSSIGGKLDGLIVDVEYLSIYAYYLENNVSKKDPAIYKKIVENPAYQEKIRPMLVERGFKFYSPVTDVTPEIYSISSKAGTEYSDCASIWNAVLHSYSNDCITQECAPVWKYYPDAIVSDYTSKDTDPWLREVSDTGGYSDGAGGKIFTAGNSSNESFYTVRPNTYFNGSGKYNTLPGYTKTVYETSQFGRFKYETYIGKVSYLATDNGKVNWWYAPYVYNENATNAYYTETLYHLGMLNPTPFLGYLRLPDCGDNATLYKNTLTIANEIMLELTRIVGAADRKPIAVNATFNGDYVLSGMYAGGKNYWRITPDNTKVSLEAFKTDAADPTFSAGGETITFPGGKIIADSKISEIGSCGYWIETDKDVMPVVTRPEDFFRKYPAYQETFDTYEVGTEYTYNNAQPKDSWEVKKSGGGSGVVIADPANGENKVLEIKGNFSARNIKMSANVRAGDVYAKRQAWEVSFTLPSDMPADAELVLLKAANEKKVAKDGGIKIASGKVYYSQNGEYAELEGVALTAGTKYTVIREFDFTNEEAYTCNYSVYGPDGTQLGKARKVAIEKLVLPVYSAGVACTKVTGGAILLDDFKLYQTAVATDLYLYDDALGTRIADPEKGNDSDITFRLSWLNATNAEKSYTVMAAYYDGETLVSEEAAQELKLTANGNGVIFGTVEHKQEGKTLRVYLRDNNPAEEEEEVVTPGGDEPVVDEPKPAGLDTTMIIIIAAAAAVVIAVVVIVIVASAKKKKRTSDNEITEE